MNEHEQMNNIMNKLMNDTINETINDKGMLKYME